MKDKVKEAINKGFKNGAKTICMVSEKEGVIIGKPYVNGDRLHVKTNDMASGFMIIYDNGEFSKLL